MRGGVTGTRTHAPRLAIDEHGTWTAAAAPSEPIIRWLPFQPDVANASASAVSVVAVPPHVAVRPAATTAAATPAAAGKPNAATSDARPGQHGLRTDERHGKPCLRQHEP